MTIAVTSSVLEALLEEARAAHPREACGLLFGHGDAITAHQPVANVHPAPETRFELDPQALIGAYRAMRQGGPGLLGYYHSHPAGPPEPSDTDRAQAARDGMIWAIAGHGEVRLWRAAADGFMPLSYIAV